ncbi:hypothetical protein JMJ35_010361 [Cladonia borealis]|uniref:SH3 domain-containing protein n=1 Tax=Cladonia borealis TaxID=184061 RepID=A0AA39QTA0_9LECA|nr:hypothetical protein JMJ35_010361 [Cladonia borealis]
MSSLTDLDPTGVLSAAGAAVGLVRVVLRTVPALKNATNSMRNNSNINQGPINLHRAQTASEAPILGVDPERERRAYETVNFVLREFGTRICAAGLVDEHALTKALTAAAQHIEVKLFSGEANRLFASLAPRLGDPILVSSVFTSIYFIGALTAELSRSLPNYKESYIPLGPRIVQQLFRTAIGEDAFRENLSANLDAYKTLAATAGLLRPTDIGYSSFPGFPAFSPCRYSSKSFGDVRNHRIIFEKLVRHFDKFGFPQPIASRQAEAGLIREWRFLDADSPSHNFDVEKADKNIGENFGRVIHWLICSADRLPPGQAVIAYYDQHVELIKWMGQRMGYSILHAASELDLGGVHSQLDKKSRATVDTWVLLMPSEKAQATRRASAAQWAQSHKQNTEQALPAQHPQPQPLQPTNFPVQAFQKATVPPVVPVASSPQAKSGPIFTPKEQGPVPFQAPQKTIEERLDAVQVELTNSIIPQCQKLLAKPASDLNTRTFELKRLTQHIEKGIINWVDGFSIPSDHPARVRRKDIIVQAQKLLHALDVGSKNWSVDNPQQNSTVTLPNILPTAHTTQELKVELPALTSSVQSAQQSTVTDTTSTPTSPQAQPSPAQSTSPPPYSPTTSPFSVSDVTPGFPFTGKPAVRRKAPPPPKKFVPAKALYDFEPENNDEELAFKEGDEIEIIERNAVLEEDGWCRARVRGSKKLGLAPLEYLEIEEKFLNAINPTGPAKNSVHAHASQPTSATPHGHLNSTDTGSAANGASFAGLMTAEASKPSQVSKIPASSDQTSNPIGPQIGTSTTTSAQNMAKVGKGMEVAGLALATVGTAAAVIPYVQASDTQAQPLEITEVEPVSDLIQNTSLCTESETVVGGGDSVTIAPTDSTAVVQNGYVAIAPSPPNTDLSAFSSTPFEDQMSLGASNSVIELAAIDPYFATQNADFASAPDFSSTLSGTGAPQEILSETDPGYAAPTAASPFPAEILPVVSSPGVGAMATPIEYQGQVEDESPPVMALTQQSTESVVDNLEPTSWEAQNQADDTAYDMDV